MEGFVLAIMAGLFFLAIDLIGRAIHGPSHPLPGWWILVHAFAAPIALWLLFMAREWLRDTFGGSEQASSESQWDSEWDVKPAPAAKIKPRADDAAALDGSEEGEA